MYVQVKRIIEKEKKLGKDCSIYWFLDWMEGDLNVRSTVGNGRDFKQTK